MNTYHHPFHVLPISPLPIVTAFVLLFLAIGIVFFMHHYHAAIYLIFISILGLLMCLYFWWSNVINEGAIGKHHTSHVAFGLKIGMVLFILSEVMFFFVFFASFFNSSIFPAGVLDGVWVTGEGVWPPKEIKTIDPWDIPFINTLILLLSGTTATWAHFAVLENNTKDTAKALLITVLLGVAFTALQGYEYFHADFSISSGIYGANFYMATGFHGLHVIIGTIFLFICYLRARRGDFESNKNHLGLEFAVWYWHFIDVIWLFLFIFVYIWGG